MAAIAKVRLAPAMPCSHRTAESALERKPVISVLGARFLTFEFLTADAEELFTIHSVGSSAAVVQGKLVGILVPALVVFAGLVWSGLVLSTRGEWRRSGRRLTDASTAVKPARVCKSSKRSHNNLLSKSDSK